MNSPVSPVVPPEAKRSCLIDTPESFKSGVKVTSTAAKCVKSIKFGNLQLQHRRTTSSVTVHDVPTPFMERLLITAIEKQIRKLEISDDNAPCVSKCHSYNRVAKTVVVELNSPAVASALCQKKRVPFQKTFVNVTLLDSGEIDDSMQLPNSEDEEEDFKPLEVEGGGIEDPFNDLLKYCGDSRYLKVMNLPSPCDYDEEDFQDFLENFRILHEIAVPITKTVTAIGKYDKDTHSVVVEFLTSEIARKVCDLGTAQYFVDSLTFQMCDNYTSQEMQENIQEESHKELEETHEDILEKTHDDISQAIQGAVTCHILVKEVQAPFREDLFTTFIKQLLKHKVRISEHVDNAIVSLGEYNEENQSVVVEFVNSEIAQSILHLEKAQFISYNVKFQNYVPSVSCPEVSSNYVLIQKVQAPFREDLFTTFIKQLLKHKVRISEHVDSPIVSLGEYNEENQSVVVEFVSSEIAEAISDLKKTRYMYETITFQKYTPQVVSNNARPDESKHVLVKNILPPFYKDIFKDFLEYVRKERNITETVDFVVSIGEYNSDSHSVVVEFITPEVAHKICEVKDSDYLTHTPVFQKFYPNAMEEATGQQNAFIGQIVDVGCLGGDCETVAPQEKRVVIPLDCFKGDIIFLRKLVGLRHLFTGKDFKSAYVSLLGECHNEGINTDLPGVAKRRKHFMDIFSRKKRENVKEYLHWQPLSVCYGGASADILKGTVYEDHGCGEINLRDPNSVIANSQLFSQGMFFTTAASRALLVIVNANYDLYKKALNVDHYFEEVADLLKPKGHMYSGPRCRSRFLEARKLYRNEADRRQRTGQPTEVEGQDPKKAPWWWCKESHNMFKNDVTVRTPVTIAAGSSSNRQVRQPARDDECSDPEGEDDPDFHRIGKSRVTQLRLPGTKVTQKNAGMFAIADAMNRRTEVLKDKKANSS